MESAYASIPGDIAGLKAQAVDAARRAQMTSETVGRLRNAI